MSGTGRLSVQHVSEDRFTIAVRGHTVLVDQPREDGGTDTAPTPTELFAGALTSCVAFYAHRYLVRHQLPETGLCVTASYTMGERPARVAAVMLHVTTPPGLTTEQRKALLAVASHCTVHNTLEQPPVVTIELGGESEAAVA